MSKDETWIRLEKGIRCKKHPTRKHGVKPDTYFVLRFAVDGKMYQEALGWASEGITLAKARVELARLKEAKRLGEGPRSLRERRDIAEEERKAREEEERAREKYLADRRRELEDLRKQAQECETQYRQMQQKCHQTSIKLEQTRRIITFFTAIGSTDSFGLLSQQIQEQLEQEEQSVEELRKKYNDLRNRVRDLSSVIG